MLANLTTSTLYILAGNPHLSEITLDELSRSTDLQVRARVAENRNTPLRTLLRLATDVDVEVRQSILFNPSVTVSLLTHLAGDVHADVRYAVAENALIPEVLQKLTKDENPYVADRAMRSLSRLRTAAVMSAAA